MEVPREDMEQIRAALVLADNYATLTGASGPTLDKIRGAQERVRWLLSDAPDPLDDPKNPQIMRGWLRERPEDER
jgi:hypothetical protein